jgi:hypothetical protein
LAGGSAGGSASAGGSTGRSALAGGSACGVARARSLVGSSSESDHGAKLPPGGARGNGGMRRSHGWMGPCWGWRGREQHQRSSGEPCTDPGQQLPLTQQERAGSNGGRCSAARANNCDEHNSGRVGRGSVGMSNRMLGSGDRAADRQRQRAFFQRSRWKRRRMVKISSRPTSIRNMSTQSDEDPIQP